MQGLDELYMGCHGTLTSAEDVLMRTGWDSLETTYKVRLTEFLFKCIKGYTVKECKDLFLQTNSGRRRNKKTSFF